MNIQLPIDIEKGSGQLKRTDSTAKSIDAHLKLIISTPRNSCVCDPDFGFVFNNFKFEIFNEQDGVVNYDSTSIEESAQELDLYNRKISGTSKNINTFAKEFQDVVEKYEKRLTDITISMAYIREQRIINLSLKGTIKRSNTSYNFDTVINVWNRH